MAFDKEGFQTYLNTEEGKEWFDTFTASLGYKSKDEVKEAVEKENLRIDKKNKDLLSEKKILKETIENNKENVENSEKIEHLLTDLEIGLDESGKVVYTILEKALEGLRSSGAEKGDPEAIIQFERKLKKSQRDYDALDRDFKKRGVELEGLNVQLGERDTFIAKDRINREFESSLRIEKYSDYVIQNILPSLRDKAKAQLQFDEDTGERSAIVDDGGTISDWVKSWKDTDEGKALRLAPINTGGGSGGGGSGGSAKKWSEMSITERAELYSQDVEKYRRLKGGN